MKVARVGIVAIAVMAVATLAWAQKPDFSGTWTLDPEASEMPAGAPGGGGGGGRMGGGRGGSLGQNPTIKQTADMLTVERTMMDNRVVSTYKLDGSESRNTLVTGRGEIETVSVAKWDGSALVITTKTGMGETTQRWTLNGNVLTVETTGGRGGPSKLVYRK